jgi:hypothetical protein
MLRISERAVRKQIETGKLTAERDGNRWLITLAEPDAVPGPEPRGTGAVPPEPKRGTDSEPIEADYRPIADEASQRYLDELRDVWLMPLIHENGDLREELGKLTAERDQALADQAERIGRLQAERDQAITERTERVKQLQAERDQLRIELEQTRAKAARETATNDESHTETDNASLAPKNGRLARLRQWVKERMEG